MRFALIGLLVVSLGLSGCTSQSSDSIELLNVSCDPTRELWQDINKKFAANYERETGKRVDIRQSHGGSGSQARAIIDGLEADVATLALWSDTDAIRAKGLIDPGWEQRLPNNSLPYFSTIVFVVRKGNPKQIKDWPDLVREGVEIITPSPKTSGNGRLSFLAAWGAVLQGKGTEEQAKEFVTQLYKQVPILDAAARSATTTFVQRKRGDVHLTWENEAYLAMAEKPGELEIIYPKTSIKAEPYVAVVDANVRRKGTAKAAEAYLKFVYTDEAQELVAKNFYRPINEKILEKHAATLPPVNLFPITAVAKDWDDAQHRFFDPGAVFDQIYTNRK